MVVLSEALSEVDDFLDEPAAAADLGVPLNTLRYWRTLGKGPRFYKIGRRVQIRRRDIQAYRETCAREPGAKGAA